MKHLNTYITEYIIKKKLDNPIDSSGYKYQPTNKEKLISTIKLLLADNKTNFNCIDTSEITDMSNLFNGVKDTDKFNFDVSNWDVSKVKDMSNMFNGCGNFDCDLSNWDVSNVENMSTMFYNCEKFEGKGLENWDVSKVKDMSNMFHWCLKFDCDLSGWDVSKVENMDNMFCLTPFTGKGLEKWNVSNIYNMRGMFHGCNEFDCDLSNWDVSNVIDMEGMFRGCKKFKGRGLDNWNPINLKIVRVMFNDCDMKDKPKWFYDKCYKNKKRSNINYNSFF